MNSGSPPDLRQIFLSGFAPKRLKKLSAYPRQNGLAVALRELGRLERTLFTLEWFKNIDLRRRTNAGLNKGEARNALARAIFFYRLGEMRDRSFESQAYRASGLNLLVAAVILWNTVYLERSFDGLRREGRDCQAGARQACRPARMGAYRADRGLCLEQ
jgi:TnpA family transposase